VQSVNEVEKRDGFISIVKEAEGVVNIAFVEERSNWRVGKALFQVTHKKVSKGGS